MSQHLVFDKKSLIFSITASIILTMIATLLGSCASTMRAPQSSHKAKTVRQQAISETMDNEDPDDISSTTDDNSNQPRQTASKTAKSSEKNKKTAKDGKKYQVFKIIKFDLENRQMLVESTDAADPEQLSETEQLTETTDDGQAEPTADNAVIKVKKDPVRQPTSNHTAKTIKQTSGTSHVTSPASKKPKKDGKRLILKSQKAKNMTEVESQTLPETDVLYVN